jgi:chromosome partitioning protein
MNVKIIAIANQKGGVAKTTTTAAMAAGLKRKGYRVLAVDLDAQGNLTTNVGAETDDLATTYDVMRGNSTAEEAIQHFGFFDILPADLALASADMEFVQTGREYKLKKALVSVEKDYDFILLDTPPTLGIMTTNAFFAADEVLIPANGFDGVKGIVNLVNSVNTAKEYGNANLKISGILLTRYNPRTNIEQGIKELAEAVANQIGSKVFHTYIRTSVMVDEAKANKTDIFSYDGKNNVSKDYVNFIDEFLEELVNE